MDSKKKKELKKLEQELIRAKRELTFAQHQKQRYMNRIRYAQNQSRKERTHHLCNVGGAVDTLLPISKALSKVQFYQFLEELVHLPEVKDLIDKTMQEKLSEEEQLRLQNDAGDKEHM